MSIAKNLKLSFFGLLSATLMSAPAFAQNAASVTQVSGQSTDQVGIGNTAIQGNLQSTDISQTGNPSYFYGSGANGATVGQSNNQYAGQYGYGNSAIQGNASSATVTQGSTPIYPGYPIYPAPVPNFNGASVLQGNGQGASQVGAFNGAVQGNAATTNVQQH